MSMNIAADMESTGVIGFLRLERGGPEISLEFKKGEYSIPVMVTLDGHVVKRYLGLVPARMGFGPNGPEPLPGPNMELVLSDRPVEEIMRRNEALFAKNPVGAAGEQVAGSAFMKEAAEAAAKAEAEALAAKEAAAKAEAEKKAAEEKAAAEKAAADAKAEAEKKAAEEKAAAEKAESDKKKK